MDPLQAVASSSSLSGPFWSFATPLLHVVLPIALATLAFSRAWFAREAARACDANARSAATLDPGLAVFHGPVEYAQGSTCAVRVEIEQQGAEHVDKGGVIRHSWREVDRTIQAQPFYVDDARGRVRVEPNARTMLVDDLDVTQDKSRETRVRVAELSPGEVVYVLGHLRSGIAPGGGAYRESAMAPVLEPPRRGRMLVSSKPLGTIYREAASRESRWGLLVVALAVAAFLLDLGFHLRMHTGVYERATVVGTRLYRGKGAHCAVELRADDGTTFTDQVAYDGCPPVAPGVRVPVVRVPSAPWLSQIGHAPGVSLVNFVLSTVTLCALALFYTRRARPWWERRLEEMGQGPLRS